MTGLWERRVERIRGLSSPDTVKRLCYSVSSRGRLNDVIRLTVPWACKLRGFGMCDILCVCEGMGLVLV